MNPARRIRAKVHAGAWPGGRVCSGQSHCLDLLISRPPEVGRKTHVDLTLTLYALRDKGLPGWRSLAIGKTPAGLGRRSTRGDEEFPRASRGPA